MKREKNRFMLIATVAALFFALDFAHAAVVAKIDRANVEQNESFDLELIVDTDTDSVPDLSVLEADFDIGSTSQLTNTSIVNGQISHSRTWKVTLMAKRSGTITIPAISIGSERSDAISINVREPSDEPPGEADVFITAEVDFDQTYVQAQVLYTIKIYRAVPWRQPALREPSFDGAEVLVELVGDESDYQAVLNGRAYDVIQRTYAIFPQQSGDVTISPARFEARVLRDGRITGRKVFESETQHVTVKPIPPPPPDHPDAAWLPAVDVTLEDNWSREPDDLSAGEPISRNVTVSALGQLETQLPVIDPPVADGVSIYPDKPALGRRIEAGGIRGIRTDQYAMIANKSGAVSLPSLELPWWDIAAGEWRIARLPEHSVNILPSDDVTVSAPAFEVAPASAANEVPQPSAVHSTFWRRIAELLTFVWLLTIVAWWWSTRPRREPRGPEPIPLHKQQARYLKDARKAALARDAHGVRQALLEWGRLQWPGDAPRSIGEFATRVSAPMSDELTQLSRSSYGAQSAEWNGDSLAQAIRSFSTIDPALSNRTEDLLPPLLPTQETASLRQLR